MAVAITRQALGLREGPAFAHFALGSAELRVFGGFFALYLLLILFLLAMVLIIVVAAAVVAVVAKTNAGATPVLGGILGLLGVIGSLALLYIFVRLSFLFIPAAVNDGDFGLTRSWELTKGNFWRIVAIGLAAFVPVMIVIGIAEYFILGPAYFAAQLEAMRHPADAARYTSEQMRLMQTRMPYLIGLGLILAPVTQGLIFSPAAFAYRVLTGKPKPLPDA